MTREEACRILGVSEAATPAEIKTRYLFLINIFHPDKNIDKPETIRLKAQDEFIRIKAAYEFLTSHTQDIKRPPKLEATPKYIRFKEVALSQKKTTTIEVKNIGGPFTNLWIDDSPCPWLSVIDVKSISNEPLHLMITIEATGAPGLNQRCMLPIRLTNEKTGLSDELQISIEVTHKNQPAKLNVKHSALSFRNLPLGINMTGVLEIENLGQNILKGHVSTRPGWLSASPIAVNVPGQTTVTHTVNINTDNLGEGFTDVGYITIDTNGGSLSLPVDLSTIKTATFVYPKIKQKKQSNGWVKALISLGLISLLIFIYIQYQNTNSAVYTPTNTTTIASKISWALLTPKINTPGSEVYPGLILNTLSPVFTWQSIADAELYHLWVFEYPFNVSNVVYDADYFGLVGTIPVGVLQPGRYYAWNLKAFGKDTWSLASNPLYFGTPSQTMTPTNLQTIITSPPVIPTPSTRLTTSIETKTTVAPTTSSVNKNLVLTKAPLSLQAVTHPSAYKDLCLLCHAAGMGPQAYPLPPTWTGTTLTPGTWIITLGSDQDHTGRTTTADCVKGGCHTTSW